MSTKSSGVVKRYHRKNQLMRKTNADQKKSEKLFGKTIPMGISNIMATGHASTGEWRQEKSAWPRRKASKIRARCEGTGWLQRMSVEHI
jgi:hypothetical protein